MNMGLIKSKKKVIIETPEQLLLYAAAHSIIGVVKEACAYTNDYKHSVGIKS